MNEFYRSSEYKSFEEQKTFKAEQYVKAKDINETGKELTQSGHEFKPEMKKNEKKQASSNPLKRLIDKMSNSATSVATSVVTTVTIAAASVAVLLNLTAPAPELDLIELNAGNDYVEYSLSVDELDKDIEYSVVVENPYHSFEYEINDEGVYENLVTGLKPGMAYSLSLVGDSDGNKTTYYEQDFYTTNTDTPSAIFDIDLTKGSKEGTANIEYSVYVSKGGGGGSYLLEMKNDGKSYYRDTKMENGFFKGVALAVPRGRTEITVLCQKNGQDLVVGRQEIINSITPEPPIEKPPIDEPIVIPDLEISEFTLTGVNYGRIEILVNKRQEIILDNTKSVCVDIYYDDVLAMETSLYEINPAGIGLINVEIADNCSSIRVVAKIVKNDGLSEPLVEYSVEKTFELTKGIKIYPSVNLESKSAYIDCVGVVPYDSVIVVKDDKTGDRVEYAIYDEMYSSCRSRIYFDYGQDKAEYTFLLKDSTEGEGTELGTYVIDFTAEKSEFEMMYSNPGDCVVTYNDDHTMNVYIYTNFTTTDPDLYCEMEFDKTYKSRDPVFVFEGVRQDFYGIRYLVCKEINGVKYIMSDMTPSGAINEGYYSAPLAYLTETGLGVKFTNDGTYDLTELGFVSSSGEEIKIGFEDLTLDAQTDTYIAQLVFEEEFKRVYAYLKAKNTAQSEYYDEITSMVELKGEIYKPCEILIYSK